MCLIRQSGKGSSLLKCLECKWKWRSKRKYVDKLPDHIERSQAGLTDSDVLARLIAGTLVVDLHTATVLSFNSNTRQWGELRQRCRRSHGGPEYRFVRVCLSGKQKAISVHRLVWMAANGRVPPLGYDVHHRRHDVPNPDTLTNLRLEESAVNRGKKTQDDDW